MTDPIRITAGSSAGRTPRSAFLIASCACAITSGMCAPAGAQPVLDDRPAASSAYLQLGLDGARRSYGLGATRDWPSTWGASIGRALITGYWQGGADFWTYPAPDDEPSGATRLVKIEAAPILRLRGDDGRSRWFVDAGIGLTLTSRLYRSGPTRASTAFNFGDQIAAGWSFGPRREHEVALRFEHMSNGAIKQPNPAINTWQLRYARRFGSD